MTKVVARLWRAIGKPPSLGIDRTMAIIHGKLAEVTSQANIQLHHRSKKIQLTVEDNNVHIKKLQVSNVELERLNGLLQRSLERLEIQHEEFVAQVESMWLPLMAFDIVLPSKADMLCSCGNSER